MAESEELAAPRWRRWLPTIISVAAVVAMCAFIFYMSQRPADESDAMSLGLIGRFVGFIVPGYDQMSFDDQMYWQKLLNYPVRKLAHFTEYAVLGALVLNMLLQIARVRGVASPLRIGPRAAAAWALCTLYAATDEVHQLFVSGRTGKPTDVLIDSCGILFGIAVFVLILYLVRRRRGRRASDS